LLRQGIPQEEACSLAVRAHEDCCWLLIDGPNAPQAPAELNLLLRAVRFWKCRLLITLGSVCGMETRPLTEPVEELRLAPLSLDQGRLFIERWFAEPGSRLKRNGASRPVPHRTACAVPLLDRLERPEMRSFRDNPLWLGLLCAQLAEPG